MKYINLKLYLTAILINILPLIFGTLSCSGESCMVIFITLGYWIACIISYTPYILINTRVIQSKIEKGFVFFLPTIILTIISFITESTIFGKNLMLLLLIILPNIIIQSILLTYYLNKEKGNIPAIYERIKKWNSS